MVTKRIVLAGDAYRILTDRVYARDGWACRCCKYRAKLHAHHVIFRSQGGSDTMENLITLCAYCHDAVHAGNLIITTLEASVKNRYFPDYSFVKLNGWKPKWLVL